MRLKNQIPLTPRGQLLELRYLIKSVQVWIPLTICWACCVMKRRTATRRMCGNCGDDEALLLLLPFNSHPPSLLQSLATVRWVRFPSSAPENEFSLVSLIRNPYPRPKALWFYKTQWSLCCHSILDAFLMLSVNLLAYQTILKTVWILNPSSSRSFVSNLLSQSIALCACLDEDKQLTTCPVLLNCLLAYLFVCLFVAFVSWLSSHVLSMAYMALLLPAPNGYMR